LLQLVAAVPGVEVIESAGSPAEAALQVDRLAPALVLIDWSLPRGGGEASCRLIRARPAPPRIVALLNDDGDADRASAAAAGTDAMLGKGRLSEALLPLLDELFPVRRP
jgi:DNA-binding NarL/FixJ family response regulator